LAFHPYPQVIPQFFNTGGFGPPRSFTHASACPWIAHPASCLRQKTQRPVQTRFPFGFGYNPLTLPFTVTPRFIIQEARRHPSPKGIGLRQFVGTRFQVLFHSPPGVLFTFPSRYWSTIGHQECLALGDGPPSFPSGFTCPVVLRNRTGIRWFSHTGLSPSSAQLSSCFH
jgi:hypothetical protein